jgi:hypothetical protein
LRDKPDGKTLGVKEGEQKYDKSQNQSTKSRVVEKAQGVKQQETNRMGGQPNLRMVTQS